MEHMTPEQLFVIVLCAVLVLVIQALWANADTLIVWWGQRRSVKRFQDVAPDDADHYVEDAPPSHTGTPRPEDASHVASSASDGGVRTNQDGGRDELVIPAILTYDEAVTLLATIQILDDDGAASGRSADKIAAFVGKRAEIVRPLVKAVRQPEAPLTPDPPAAAPPPARVIRVNGGKDELVVDW